MVRDRTFWQGRRVAITGHTGFKGAWLSLLLVSLGAKVHGFSLPPESEDGIFRVTGVEKDIAHTIGDVRDLAALERFMEACRPEVVFHLAAQALVRASYSDPVQTYATNVMGTVNVLDTARRTPGIEAVVVVTSDKCYENTGSIWGFREIDRMGGHDPYSNSKGCAELVTSAYRQSFFHGEGAARISSARAGNVIGGGDWSGDRLVPDAIRAFTSAKTLMVRNPQAIRPWQHVLDPLVGYLHLAQRLVTDGHAFAEGWNFGPTSDSEVPVRRIVDTLARLWGGDAKWSIDTRTAVTEAAVLRLDCTKATTILGWRPLVALDDALRLTIEWYRALGAGIDMRKFTLAQISAIIDR